MDQRLMIAIGVLVLVCCSLAAWLWLAPSGEESTDSASPASPASLFAPSQPAVAAAAPAVDLAAAAAAGESMINTREPDSQLASFAFEPVDKPLFVPNKDAVLERKPAGNAPYKLVQCGDGTSAGASYAIRWNQRYLTVYGPNKLEWNEQKKEPDSCFKIVPGNCNGDAFVMLRAMYNNMFVRYDNATLALVARDIPTARTALQYCWKLKPDETLKQPCGCQYSYDLGRVVCTPCDVKKMPDPASASCSTVTAGYQAECCLAKGAAGAAQDPFCKAAVFTEIVGRSIKEAMLYIRTRRPDLQMQPCPMPCTVSGYPTPTPNTVVIPYDPRTDLVTAPARVLV